VRIESLGLHVCEGVCVRPCVCMCVRAYVRVWWERGDRELVREKEPVLADCSWIDTSHSLNVIKHVCIIPHHDCVTFD
jgi:hypothetical protein